MPSSQVIDCLTNLNDHTFEVVVQVLVGEAQDGMASLPHPAVTGGILLRAQIVAEAVELDYQFQLAAQEIGEVWSYGHLSVEPGPWPAARELLP